MLIYHRPHVPGAGDRGLSDGGKAANFLKRDALALAVLIARSLRLRQRGRLILRPQPRSGGLRSRRVILHGVARWQRPLRWPRRRSARGGARRPYWRRVLGQRQGRSNQRHWPSGLDATAGGRGGQQRQLVWRQRLVCKRLRVRRRNEGRGRLRMPVNQGTSEGSRNTQSNVRNGSMLLRFAPGGSSVLASTRSGLVGLLCAIGGVGLHDGRQPCAAAGVFGHARCRDVGQVDHFHVCRGNVISLVPALRNGTPDLGIGLHQLPCGGCHKLHNNGCVHWRWGPWGRRHGAAAAQPPEDASLRRHRNSKPVALRLAWVESSHAGEAAAEESTFASPVLPFQADTGVARRTSCKHEHDLREVVHGLRGTNMRTQQLFLHTVQHVDGRRGSNLFTAVSERKAQGCQGQHCGVVLVGFWEAPRGRVRDEDFEQVGGQGWELHHDVKTGRRRGAGGVAI
mmetsp:Transcript_85180/g.237777  ORF Transcript_85180/g.237777 Transcript_85180/m.237777 type:complete len:454 (-) Transcript_85180:778-2139(-)